MVKKGKQVKTHLRKKKKKKQEKIYVTEYITRRGAGEMFKSEINTGNIQKRRTVLMRTSHPSERIGDIGRSIYTSTHRGFWGLFCYSITVLILCTIGRFDRV